jgi:hypothetical protein
MFFSFGKKRKKEKKNNIKEQITNRSQYKEKKDSDF